MEEFAYIASHDLQEPLRKISTFSSLLSEKLGGEIREDANLFLKRIIASADSMRTLIDHLLEFSRITRTNEPFRPTSLSFVLQEVRNELELKIEETGASIEASALPTIQASVMQMKQLFSNILGNAIKFRKPDVPPVIRIGHAELSTSEKREYGLKAEKRYFIIKVSDNGIGFDEAYASRIFQIFQRLHGKTEYPGSGIGLAICKRIADNHHGLIFAESAGNQGACFTVILPES